MGKYCPDCGKERPLSEFSKHKGKPGNLETYCRVHMGVRRKKQAQARNPSAEKKVGPPKILPLKYRSLNADAFERFFNEFAAPLELPAHSKQWVEAALSERNLLLNVPPRHAKSTIVAEWLPIWLLARDRNTQILIISKTTTLGMKLARKIAHHLEFDDRLLKVTGWFRSPESDRPWRPNSGELEIDGRDRGLKSGDLSLQIRGAQQQVLGMEADWVIADDVTDRRVARSETERDNESEWFHAEVLSRLNPTGHAVCIGQRVHSMDLYGQLQEEVNDDGLPVWHLETSPAVLDWETEQVLWPEVWNIKSLKISRDRLGSDLFECYYQQNPSEGGSFVHRWWIEGNGEPDTPGCLDYGRAAGYGWKQPEGEYIPITRVVSIDPSPTRYAGIVVADIPWFPAMTTFWCGVVDVMRDKMGLRSLLENIEYIQDAYHPTHCIIEENSVKWLKEDPAWQILSPMFQTVIAHNTGRNKADPDMGVWSLAADFERGRIRLPYGDADGRNASEFLIREALAYPNGQTDDVLMALWFIKYNHKRMRPMQPSNPNKWRGFGTHGGWSDAFKKRVAR